MKILILCTGNSCRSQMAAGFLRSFDPDIDVYSAGTDPAEKVHPEAIRVMKELGIDISRNSPTLVDEYLDMDFDYVVTVCDDANETCPAFPGKVKSRMHIGFEDPVKARGTEDEILNVFRNVRDQIKDTFNELYHKELVK